MTPEQERELADAIVSCGVGEKREFPGRYQHNGATLWQERFIRDWRVAGALMQKCREKDYVISINPDGVVMVFTDRDEPYDCCEADSTEWPEAICEACVAALRGKDEGDQV